KPVAAGGHVTLLLVDVNGDGRLDLVAAANGGVSVIVNDGFGRFEPAQTLLTNEGALDWSVTQVPGPPGELPTLWAAATVGSSLFPLRYVPADRQVEVLIPQSINTSYAITDLAVADLNNDGTHDLVVLDSNGGTSLHAL